METAMCSGENGTIDGQGSAWWDMWKKGTLLYTRPHLLELMSTSDIIVSNVVFQDSPFWNIHPVYCRWATQFCLPTSDQNLNVFLVPYACLQRGNHWTTHELGRDDALPSFWHFFAVQMLCSFGHIVVLMLYAVTLSRRVQLVPSFICTIIDCARTLG